MATVSFETTMTIDNEEQMQAVLDALKDAETRGPLKYTPEEIEAKMAADLEFFLRSLDQ